MIAEDRSWWFTLLTDRLNRRSPGVLLAAFHATRL
jgi:hypothetical protein